MIDTGLYLRQALAAAGVVGTWYWQIAEGGVVLDRGSAALLAGDADLAGRVLNLDASFACLHPDYRERVLALVDAHERRGGANVMEYRVRPPGGGVRVLLDGGRVVEELDGTRLGYGLLFDITDAPSTGLAALSDLAGRFLDLRDLVLRQGTPRMQLLIDLLLLETGFAIAGEGTGSCAGPVH